MTYYFPLSADEDRAIRAEVTKKLVERSDNNFDSWFKEMPGMKEKSGRERLLFYQETSEGYWTELLLTYPRVAKAALMDWASLLQRYPEMGLIQQMMPMEPMI